jgi:hypothetical protein
MTTGSLRVVEFRSDVAVPSITRAISSPTSGVVIVDVSVGPPTSISNLHWRAGDWTKPPLDMSLSHSGHLESIQFVFQDEEVRQSHETAPIVEQRGSPIFDTTAWTKKRYWDIRCPVHAETLSSHELRISIGGQSATQYVEVGIGLAFGLDEDEAVTNVLIGPLRPVEIGVLGAAIAGK